MSPLWQDGIVKGLAVRDEKGRLRRATNSASWFQGLPEKNMFNPHVLPRWNILQMNKRSWWQVFLHLAKSMCRTVMTSKPIILDSFCQPKVYANLISGQWIWMSRNDGSCTLPWIEGLHKEACHRMPLCWTSNSYFECLDSDCRSAPWTHGEVCCSCWKPLEKVPNLIVSKHDQQCVPDVLGWLSGSSSWSSSFVLMRCISAAIRAAPIADRTNAELVPS